MEFLGLTPLDELGLQAGCYPHRTTCQCFLGCSDMFYLDVPYTNPKRLKSVDTFLVEKQNQYDLKRQHVSCDNRKLTTCDYVKLITLITRYRFVFNALIV